jgi:hypothetical protein
MKKKSLFLLQKKMKENKDHMCTKLAKRVRDVLMMSYDDGMKIQGKLGS